jgi:hypothetical protein
VNSALSLLLGGGSTDPTLIKLCSHGLTSVTTVVEVIL